MFCRDWTQFGLIMRGKNCLYLFINLLILVGEKRST